MTTIAIIPARGGSRRIPRKNIRDFEGKPIIAYSIETALQAKVFSKVYVTTEDDEIAAVAKQYGAEPIKRRPGLADDQTGTQRVVQATLMDLGYGQRQFDKACCIYATSPLMRVIDLLEGKHHLTPDVDYAFSVSIEPLADAGQFYWGWTGSFMAAKPLVSPMSRMIPIPPEHCCDINTEADWQWALGQYRKNRKVRRK